THAQHRGSGVMRDDPVDARDHVTERAGPLAIQHPNAHQADALGDPVRGTAHRPGYVRAVPIAVGGIRIVIDEVVTAYGRPPDFVVREADARVHDVGGDAGAGRDVPVLIVTRRRPLVDPVQAPSRAGL